MLNMWEKRGPFSYLRLVIESGGGLVEQQDLRLVDQGTRDGDALCDDQVSRSIFRTLVPSLSW
jgi:hypothetical protein|eukprot:COSAG06_NODE_1663_length_8768_cov_17.382166_3_plen_63_part_00